MPDILQDFPIRVAPARAFEAVSQPRHLDEWWTIRSSGQPAVGTAYELDFGPEYLWRAVVTRCVPGEAFELRLTEADRDWTGTLVGFALSPSESGTLVQFAHRGWPEANAHFRTSSHCWALYLRVLRRYLEFGETVPYDRRLDV
jgi:uncharacterized protein YndB with AHSA1/START domain